ncbi:creatininase family protein [Chitinispirillales bacterium ANBcel5]|uniref:creatininase family protein n=1 Tax=Cellulosispirillum alkaliphilum TaxID=3039283 RepID=UPI002A5259C6|nr:creatininase family protein [Chitinispirillales bacterium ANBcel5]
MNSYEKEKHLYSIEDLSFLEVQYRLREQPVLVVVLGGTETYSCKAVNGIATRICRSFGEALCSKMDLLMAPVLPFGCSVPYMAFEGTSGIKPKTLTYLLGDLFRCWIFQKFRYFFVINPLAANSESLNEVSGRLAGSKSEVQFKIVDFHNDETIHKILKNNDAILPGAERFEKAFLALASFLYPSMVRNCDAFGYKVSQEWDRKRYRSWKKRGADPAKYRKLFPSGVVDPDVVSGLHAQKGGNIYEEILNYLMRETENFLNGKIKGYNA